MKTKPFSIALTAAALLLGAAYGFAIKDADPGATALDLAKLGNQYVSEGARDQVVQIRSEKSSLSLKPNIWYVVYYDRSAPLKAVQVKFVNGRMSEVDRPLRLLEPIFGNDRPMGMSQVRIDSDEAIDIAKRQPMLDSQKLTAVSAKLEHGEDSTPVWKLQFWSAKSRDYDTEEDLGEIVLSALDGSVQKTTLEISSNK